MWNKKEAIKKSNEVMDKFVPPPVPQPIRPIKKEKEIVVRVQKAPHVQPLVPRPIKEVRPRKPMKVELITPDLRGQGRTEDRGREVRV